MRNSPGLWERLAKFDRPVGVGSVNQRNVTLSDPSIVGALPLSRTMSMVMWIALAGCSAAPATPAEEAMEAMFALNQLDVGVLESVLGCEATPAAHGYACDSHLGAVVVHRGNTPGYGEAALVALAPRECLKRDDVAC